MESISYAPRLGAKHDGSAREARAVACGRVPPVPRHRYGRETLPTADLSFSAKWSLDAAKAPPAPRHRKSQQRVHCRSAGHRCPVPGAQWPNRQRAVASAHRHGTHTKTRPLKRFTRSDLLGPSALSLRATLPHVHANDGQRTRCRSSCSRCTQLLSEPRLLASGYSMRLIMF